MFYIINIGQLEIRKNIRVRQKVYWIIKVDSLVRKSIDLNWRRIVL